MTHGKYLLYNLQNGLCYFCGDKMEYSSKLVIHHKDHNHYNNELKNRCLVHWKCHNKIHSIEGRNYNHPLHKALLQTFI